MLDLISSAGCSSLFLAMCLVCQRFSSAAHRGCHLFGLLSSPGFYKTPDVTGFGGDRPFNYFTYGAAVAEVELDCLTGDFQVTGGRAYDQIIQPVQICMASRTKRCSQRRCACRSLHAHRYQTCVCSNVQPPASRRFAGRTL